ncbi:hypothetical protein AJ78_01696 [Emergomyces pasteurianus Ep9510]|uniref:Uncharacterized protein n=1 Tax=Emergomyces pasteurianus Ep9510 TaxID=1447872 RepID=A0A1J9PPA3_9EURO|nr:hypothetical protein AJ78_01696 [Emergomyces pasteurianus Ep9510]
MTSNASCSRPPGILVPCVLEYEIPSYIVDAALPKAPINTTAHQAVYSTWISTNGLGNQVFLADMQTPKKAYVECTFSALDKLYRQGAWYFVPMNVPSLQSTAGTAVCGPGAKRCRMWQRVTMVTGAYRYRTGYEVLVARRYAGLGQQL